jgi:hypothetical protein
MNRRPAATTVTGSCIKRRRLAGLGKGCSPLVVTAGLADRPLAPPQINQLASSGQTPDGALFARREWRTRTGQDLSSLSRLSWMSLVVRLLRNTFSAKSLGAPLSRTPPAAAPGQGRQGADAARILRCGAHRQWPAMQSHRATGK